MTFSYVTGFSNDPAAAQRSRLAAGLRIDLDRLSSEAVTGRAADQPAALDGRTAEALRIDNRLADLAGYRAAAESGEARLAAQQVSLATIRDSATALFETVETALASGLSTGLELVGDDARSALQTAVSALNLRYAGSTQFAGDATDGDALAPSQTILTTSITTATSAGGGAAGATAVRASFDTPGDAFDTAFYVGGDGDSPGIGIEDDIVAETGPRADDAALRGVLREMTTIAVIAEPGVTPDIEEQRRLLTEARDRLFGSLEPLAAEAGRLGITEARLADAATRHAAEETALGLAREQLLARDRFEAASELNSVETALSTLFAATARLSRLTLSSFLS
ncbi:MAG: hypothetical protein AAFT19_02250 [Pseudomonadota bacterium]